MPSNGRSNNPFWEGLRVPRRLTPTIFVLFGGSGDLARRKILPSIYGLAAKRALPEDFTIITVASSARTDDEYRKIAKDAISRHSHTFDEAVWQRIENRTFYLSGRFDYEDTYSDLRALIAEKRSNSQSDIGIIFYLAVQPSSLPSIINGITKTQLNHISGDAKIVIEKPFGKDLQSAYELNDLLNSSFEEKQIYRIDHYLGKDTVQNILAFRFANTILEPIWNGKYIDHIQITSAESIGVEERGRYYEEAGAMRDMLQNHMLQILTLIAMEPPASMSFDSIGDEKLKVLRAIAPFTPSSIRTDVVRGQYAAGTISGEDVKAYRDESGVSPNSMTETFIAAKLQIHGKRWSGTPFYIRTGKRLTHRKTEIYVQFKQSSCGLFQQYHPKENSIVIRIQPDEGISLCINSKTPDADMRLQPVSMDFRYLTDMGAIPQESYEKLLLDCINGDQSLFTQRAVLEEQWKLVDPILREWQQIPPPVFPNYQSGSMGPSEAFDMMMRDGRRWRRI